MVHIYRSGTFVAFLILFFSGLSLQAQTTYTWIGGNGSWAVGANWSPTRTTPATTDILQFNDGGTHAVTAVPTQTIRQLLITNNSNVTLTAATATNTLTISGLANNTNFVIGNGSALSNESGNVLSITISSNTQFSDISGTLNWNAGIIAFQAAGLNVATVSSTGIINHFGGTITSAAGRLVFADGSNYYHRAATFTLTIPTATWNTNATTHVTDITTATAIGGITGQSFGNFIYNCANQTAAAVTFQITGTATVFKGDFTLQNSGGLTRSINFKNSTTSTATININGSLNIIDGTLNANVGGTTALTLNTGGNYTQSGGTFVLTTAAIACNMTIGGDVNLSGGNFDLSTQNVAGTINFDGNYNQTGGTFQRSNTGTMVPTVNFRGADKTFFYDALNATMDNSRINYQINNANASLTLLSDFEVPASRTFTVTNGTLFCENQTVFGAGSFILANSANATLGIGSADGIVTAGANGNIQTTSRTFNVAANYIYNGGNGQVTGNALPAATTGFIQVNLTNNSDLLTLTNTTFSGNGVNLRMRRGGLANTISFTNATSSILTYEGLAAQTTSDNEFPAANGPRRLVINNPNGVTLHAARDLPTNGILTLTAGILNTSNTNVLSVLNTAAATALVGGDASSFINGPFIRAISAVGAYRFPVGDGSTFGQITASTQNAAAGVNLRASYVNSSPGGTPGANLTGLDNYYWSLERTAGTTAVDVLVTLTKPGLSPSAKVGYSPTLSGAYANIGGLIAGDEISSQNISSINNTTPDAYYSTGGPVSLSGLVTSYINLTEIANALNVNIVVGNTTFELPTTYSGEPGYPVVFTEFATDGPLHTVLIRPATGSVNFLTAGDPGTANTLIDFNGIDRVSIDGRAGGSGPIQWTFRNTRSAATFGPTFRFINGATENTLTYLNVESQAALASTGSIAFTTSTALLGGNSNNTISFCNIRENTANSALSANGIYSLGTAGALNSNNQILNNNISNYYLSAGTSSGILISTNNTGWTIENNSFYQTAARVNNGASSVGINIVNTGNDFVVKGNFIGGSSPSCGGGAYTFTGTGAGTMAAIIFNPNTAASGCEIENNTITNINWSRGTSTTAVSFIGIRNSNGNTLIKGNTIGSTTSNGAISIIENFATTPSTCNGIYQDAGASTIEDNIIGGITATGPLTTIGNNLYGIFIVGGNPLIQNNLIGSTTQANSLHAAIASTNASGQFAIGIQINSTATPINILNNTIANITNAYNAASANSFVRGINTSSSATGIVNSIGNTIFNLRNNSALVGTGVTANTAGIMHQRTAAGQTISQNIIYNIENTHPSAIVSVTGIHCSFPTSGTNVVSRNFVHSLSAASSNPSSNIVGINAFSGVATYVNNMIRLGIDGSGASITRGYNIAGIQQTSATANNLFYFNSIYVGGSNVNDNNNTYAYQRIAGTVAINLRNNIFHNERSNGSGSGSHFSIGLNASTGAISNYNIYKTDGNGGNVGQIGATPYQALIDWQGVFSNDVNSLYGPVAFVNATGNAAQLDLHIDPLSPSQNESVGIFIANYGDYDGDIRFNEPGYAGTGTAPDIGADEGEFTPADLTPPAIVYTPIPLQTVLTAPSLTATITDGSGVNGNPGTRPRLYFKYSGNANTFNSNTNATDGWKFVESVSATSPFDFVIDYSLLFGGLPSGGETIEYFVVAQDLAPGGNVGINSGIFNNTPSSVNLSASAFPIGGSVNSYLINVFSGTVTVGTGGDYPSLTNNGGLFQAINAGALSGNLTASIISDLAAESGTHALNQWTEIGIGNYTVTVRPNNNTTRTISGTFNGALFRLNGADRFIIDGRDPANLPASGRHLIFVNTSATTGASTLQFINEATNNIVRYAILRGSTTSATQAVVVFGTSAAGTLGNSDNLIEFCDVHQNASALPVNGIYSAGTAARVNANNIVRNNNIYNFFNAAGGSNGILLAANTSSWTIENNQFFQEATRTTTTASTFHYVININNTANANTLIKGNYIGGSAADGSGTMTYAAAVGNQFSPIYLNTNSTASTPTLVEDNTITNISFTTISAATSGIGPFTAIYQLAGASRITGNTIGASTGNGLITVNVNTNSNGVVNAIRYDGTSTVKIENNTIGGITVNGTGTNNGTNFYAINVALGNVAVKNNLIGSPSTSNSIQINGTATTNASVLGGINLVATSLYSDSVSFNSIYNLTNFNGGTGTRIFGISATNAAQYTIESNSIRNLILTASSSTGSNASSSVMGIALSSTNSQLLRLSGNTVHSLSNTSSTNAAWTTGIFFSGGTNTANVIEKNFVHSLSPSSGSGANVTGIQLGGGTTTNVRNNMIRLGIASGGTSITQAHNIVGILQTANNIHNIFFNSVYIGGTGVTGALNTYAYLRNQASFTTATSLRNNIFANSRSNGTGTGIHYSIGLPTSVANITSNFNLFNANGNGGAVGLEVATTHTTLINWQSSTSFDTNSLYGTPGFVNADGNASAVDMHIDVATPTQVESSGTAVGIFEDYDGDVRFGGVGYTGTGTAPDLGADEGEFLPQDLTPPFITYTPIPLQTTLSPPNLSATVTDASGVASTPGTAPRIYFKRSTDANVFNNNTSATPGWKFVESTTGISPFDLAINYNLLFGGGVSGGEIIEYFVVAQDLAIVPNVGINTGDFNSNPTSVALTSAQFPMSNFINSYLINVLSGTVTVGTGGNYLSLTNDGGLFQAINTGSLSGNLTASIISDLTTESGTHALNQWTELGLGNYTLTISPNNNTQRIISGNYAGGTAAVAGLFRFNGADRVIIDGRDPNNLPGGGRHLLFRNESATTSNFNSTFTYINDAQEHVLRYAIIEGATAGTANGVIRISTADPAGTGNDNISIDNCRIRDLSNLSATPLNGIYALGTANPRANDNISITNNDIFNIWNAASASNGIFFGANNTDISITNNHFYQTVTRTGTGAITRAAINISSTIADNININGNFIGGSAPSAGGSAMTINGNVNQTFVGIISTPSTAANNISIENNTIRNIALDHGLTVNANMFIGVQHTAGNAVINNNTIGSSTGNGSVLVQSNVAGLSGATGILVSTGSNTIENNSVGSITLTGSAATVGFSFTGISTAGSGLQTIKDNLIGSNTTANSINASNAVSSSMAQRMVGINHAATGNSVIEGNTIARLNSNHTSANTGAQVLGIQTSSGTSGLVSILQNQITHLSAASSNAATAQNTSVIGISNLRTTTTAPGHQISGNIIHSLSNSHSSASVSIAGIVYNGGTSGTHSINKNFVHSLELATSSASSVISGIVANSGVAVYHNNKVRLGIDGAGNSMNASYEIYGFQQNTTTANNAYYFNTVYIGGDLVSGNANTYSFIRTTGTTAVQLRNNLFINNRNTSSGSGLNYGIGLPGSIAGFNSNNNLFFTGGSGGRVGLQVATPQATLADWQSATSQEALSFYENISLVNPNGNASTVDLHVNNVLPTQAESGGVDVAIYEDYDGDIRFGGVGYAGTGTAPDIGADEDDFGVLDVTPPIITYTPIADQLVLSPPTLSASIIDNSGVETTSGLAPRIYFKRSTDANTFVDNTNGTNGWKFVETVSPSTPFGLTLDYSLLFGGGVTGGETIQYFVVAQDIVSPANVGVNQAIFNANPSSVNLSAANFPVTGSINSYLINLFNGVVTVGTNPGDNFPSLTNSGGLFEAINNAALSGNLIAEITTDLLAESGLHALNEWVEVGAGNYTLTLRPNNNTDKIISGTYAGTTIINGGLYRFNGADRVIIDGRDPANLPAGGRHLLFRNQNTGNSNFNSTFNLVNDARDITIRYVNMEGASASATNGVLRLSTALAGGSGNDNVTVEHCHIRDLSNTTGLPNNAIFALGTAGLENDNISISNNELYNFWNAATSSAGVVVSAGNSAWIITGNSFYQTAPRAGSGAVTRFGIQVNNSAGSNFNISNNFIGGSQINAGGSPWTVTGNVNQNFIGITLTQNASANDGVISGNTISNINFSHGTTANPQAFIGIQSALAPNSINSNTIGNISVNEALTSGINEAHGIHILSGNAVVENNTVSGLTNATASGTLSLNGISNIGTGTVQINNNTISNLNNTYNGSLTTVQTRGIHLNSGINTASVNTIHTLSNNSEGIGAGLAASVIGISQASLTSGQTISRNTIYGLSSQAINENTQVMGILFRGTTGTNEVSRNIIHSFNHQSSGSDASMVGIMSLAGVCNYHNNMIRLGIDAGGNSVTNGLLIYGINQQSTTAGNQFLFNSVHIAGANVTGTSNTFAFLRNAGTVALTIRNNIFSNVRSNGAGSGLHYAIGASSMSNFSSDFNLFDASGNGGNVGLAVAVSHPTLLSWNTATSQDVNSYFGPPGFINGNGDAASVNLRINSLNPTQVESAGTSAGITIDVDGDLRFGDPGYAGAGTAPDIGADEGDYTFLDIIPPVIVYTPISDQTSLTAPSLQATITDNIGVNTSPGTRPRLYFKRITDANTYVDNTNTTNGWKFVESVSVANPFDFTINYNLLFGAPPTGITTIQYFVVAQDLSANVAINQGIFSGAPTSVNLTAAAFPLLAPVNSYNILVFSGVVTVGTNPGDIFPSLTNNGGAFEAINNAIVVGDLTLEITSDLTIESGTHPLNEWVESAPGNYTLTIRPADGTTRTISGTYAGANAAVAGLFRFNGADRVVIDGRDPSNLPANGRHLLFRNSNTAASNFNSTFNLINDAKDYTIRNIIVEGATAGAQNGAFRISTASASGSGNDNITLTQSIIRDLSNATATPSHGIYALGTALRLNDNITISNNEIFNYHLAGTAQNAAIYIGSNNTDFTIDNNSIYDPEIRTTASNKFGIIVDAATGGGGNFVVINNAIGGNAANANGTWQVNASGLDYRFTGISMSAAISPASLVENNTIRNFNITTGTAFQTQGSTFTGVLGSNGEYAIENNTIGSLNANSISITCSAGQFTNVHGVFHSGNAAVNVLNNSIGGISVANTSSSANIVNVYGIRAGSSTISQSINVSGNTIGSEDAPILNSTGNTYALGTSVFTGGIHIANARPTTVNNNQVRHIFYTANGTSTGAFQVAGIFRSSAAAANNVISNNTVTHIRSNSSYEGTGNNIGLSGIYFASTSNGHTVSGNTVHSIRNTRTTSGIAVQVAGIYYSSGSSTSTNSISRNFVHSLQTATTSTTATLTGLWLNSGASTISNNMIRMGVIGASSQTNNVHNGITEAAGLNLIYFNSVYIGGTGSSNAANSHAFISAVASGSRQIQNNIFFNARNNAGSGKNYAIRIGGISGLTSNFNLLHVSGTNGVLGFSGTDQLTLAVWKISTGLDANSIGHNPFFIDPNGDESNVDLHIQAPPALTPIEAAGTPIAGLDVDFDGDIRSLNTPTDIGADAGNFLNLDVAPPIISYTPVPPQASCGSPANINLEVTVTDLQTGISLVNNQPRLYLRRSIGGAPGNTWGAIPPIVGTLVSGNTNVSVWNFLIDYTSLGITPAPGNEFEYYIVAQDLAVPFNIGYTQTNAFSPVHINVATPTIFPNFSFPSNGTYSYSSPLTGTVTVGTGGDYPNFNNNVTGLFKAIMDNGIGSDLDVQVISNVDELADYFPLGVVQEFCGTGHTITIRPDAANNYIIQSNTFGANPLINFIGTKRVIIDGSFNGSGLFLTFRQRSTQSCIGTSNPTFYFSGTGSSSVSEIEIRNSIIEGNNRLTACIGPGVINFGNLLSTGQGMNNIIIDNNIIRNRSDLTQNATNTPWSLIQIGAPNSVGIPRSNIQITNNELFNFGESAIQVRQNNSGQGIGNGFVITGNKIYQAYNIPTYHYPIWMEGGINSHSHTISNNLIGGNASPNPNITGTWVNNKIDGEVQAIYVLVGGSNAAEATSIQGNKIQNFNISGTGWTNFVGIRVEAGRVRIGDEVGNVIGSEDDSPDNIISNGSGGSFITEDAAVMGIWTQSASETIIENNVVSGLSTGLGTFCFLDGIAHGSNLYFNGILYNIQGGTAIIRNNQIKNLRSSSNLQNSSVSNEGMISLFVYTNSMNNVIEGNLIQNNGLNAIANANVRIHGVMLGVLGQITNHGGVFRKNTIAALANANVGQASPNNGPEINGLVLNHGNWEVSNNMVSLRNGTTGTHIDFRNTLLIGVRDHLRNIAGQGASYFYNSIYIYGTNGGSGNANPSYCYARIPNNAGNVSGAPTTLRNNIFINDRAGIGAHRAIGNINTGSPAVGWNSSASNFNFVSTLTAGTTTRWGLTDYNWANWLIQTGGDANSSYIPAAATTVANVQLNALDLFESDYLFGNLRVALVNSDATDFIDNKGTPIAVIDDIDGDPRNPITPDIGADEFSFCQVPVVTVQPTDQLNICENSPVTFSATVIGLAPLGYQWQLSTDGGATFNNLSNAGIYSGVDSDNLQVSSVSAGMNNYIYRLEITNTCGAEQSDEVTLTVNTAPQITGYSPATFINSICSGNTSFAVTVNGNGLTYQWQFSDDNGTSWNDLSNSSTYSGVNTATLSISNVPPPNLDGFQYRLIINDACSNQLISNVGTLNIGIAIINTQPVVSQIACDGSPSFISVSASGNNPTYQWEFSSNNGISWSNATAPLFADFNTSTLTINTTQSMNGYLFRVIVNSSCNTPITSDNSLLNVQYAGQWLGLGSNWDNPANWGCGIVPTNLIDAVIPTAPVLGNVFPEVSSNNISQVKDLMIEAGASVNILADKDLSIYGGITNDGASSIGDGIIRFRGNNNQFVTSASQIEVNKLSMESSNTTSPALVLNNNLLVKAELTLSSGKIDLNGFILSLGNNGNDPVINSASSSSYLIADAAGSLVRQLTTQINKTYSFPIGDEDYYTPVSVDFSSGNLVAASALEARITGSVHPMIDAPLPGDYLTRYWTVEPLNIPASAIYNIVIRYDDNDIVGTEANLKAYKHNTSGWVAALGSGAVYEMGTASYNPALNTISWTGLMGFSDFTGIGDGQPLPVSLINFNAYPVLNHVEIVWTTATEINNDFFTIERSKDGINFEPIMQVEGAGNSNQVLNYKETDSQPYEGVSYYRLKQTDFDGQFSYSEIRVVNFNTGTIGQSLMIYPNPAIHQLFISLPPMEQQTAIEVLNALGQQVLQLQSINNSSERTLIVLPLDELSKGVYFIRIESVNLQEIKRFIKQ
jgi:hypothetical protein